MRIFVRLLGTASVGLCLWECGAPQLPPATGETSEILLLCEAPPAGALAALQAALEFPTPGLVPEEPLFRVERGDARQAGRMPREKNVVIVGRSDPPGEQVRALRRWLSAADAARVDAGGTAWCVLRDVWAGGQEVSLLVAPASALDSLLVHTGPALRRHLERSCMERASAAVRHYCATPAARALERRHGFVIAVPPSYRVEDRTPALRAVELQSASPTRSVTVFWSDGVDAAASRHDATLLSLQRDMLALLHGDSLVAGASRIDTTPLAAARPVLRGAWENHTEIAGGPLVTHFVYDAARQRLYGVQGQLFAPGQRKRAPLIELEALMLTFAVEAAP